MNFLRCLFRRHCLLCLRKSDQHFEICSCCEKNLPRILSRCRHCGVSLPESITICGKCLKKQPAFDCIIAPFAYETPIQKLIIDLKFHHKLANAKILGTLLAKQLHDTEKPDLIIPVPLHEKRLRERGFNQAIEIAKPISKTLSIPIDRLSCKRIRYTEPQSLTPAKLRRKNVKNAFEVCRDISGKHIAIIDDVATSGHTINELAHALKKAGAIKIQAWCCAKTAISSGLA